MDAAASIWNLYGTGRVFPMDFIWGSREVMRETQRAAEIRALRGCVALPRPGNEGYPCAVPDADWRSSMFDTIMLAAGVGFFVVAVLYVLACERM
jgi:hypothetical protein